SPITQRTASMMLDLPQPLGPTTPIRLLGKLTAVGSTKDLKPASLILLSRIARQWGPVSVESVETCRNRFRCRAVVYVKHARVWTRSAVRFCCSVPAKRRLYNRAPL